MGIDTTPGAIDGAYVGSDHPLVLAAVRDVVLGVQRAYRMSIGQLSFADQHDRYTAYVYLLLQLCTAGRAAKYPLPQVLTPSGIMLVADKRRLDGSVDRLIQLPGFAQRVIHEFLEYSRVLSISDPRIDSGESRALYIYHGHCAPRLALPVDLHRYIKQIAAVPDVLPSNWARKLLRTEALTLAPRERDALLGHFTAGRHPYAAISSASISTLLARMQHALDQMADKLAFGWLPPPTVAPAKIHLHAIRDFGDRSHLRPKMKRYGTSANRVTVDVPALFDAADGAVWKAIGTSHANWVERQDKDASRTSTRPSEDRSKQERIRTELNIVGHRLAVKATNYWRTMEPDEREEYGSPDLDQDQIADIVCTFLRKHYSCSIVAIRKSYVARETLMLDGAALSDLAVLEHRVLPQVQTDFEYLPARSSGDGQQVDVGRIAVAMIFRYGALHWAALDALIMAYIKSPPIEVGESRFLETTVPSVATNLMCHRINLLEPFLAALLVNERQHVLQWLEAWKRRKSQTRRGQIEAAIKQYLLSIGAHVSPALLSTLFSAARMQLMLQSSPVVAAYASSRVMSEDPGRDQLEYLMGVQRTASDKEPMGAPQMRRSTPLEDMSKSGTDRSLDFVRVLSRVGGTAKKERIRRLQGYASQASAKHRLLHQFAVHLSTAAHTRKGGSDLTSLAKRRYRENIQIVGTVLFGEEADTALDEETLQRWHEEGEVLLDGGDHHGAWKEFRVFLNANRQVVSAMGFSLGRIGSYSPHRIHNWLIRPVHITAVRRIVNSARSGIAHQRVRHAMGWVLDLVRTFGLRRSEALQIRGVDVQGDLIRVQRYEGASLKTEAATRNLPVQIADSGFQEKLIAAKANGESSIAIGTRAAPDTEPSLHRTNKLLQEQAGVPDVHFHTIRHTVASGMALALLSEHEDLRAVFGQMPWVQELVDEYETVGVLLQSEPDIGQGLQAISALLGHLHPSTTLRHYTHILCIALYAANLRRNPINMRRSFERRLQSPATMQRKQAVIVQQHAHSSDADQRRQAVNRGIQALVESRHVDSRCAEPGADSKVQSTEPAPPYMPVGEDDSASSYRFDALEGLYAALLEGKASIAARDALDSLYAIPCGKRGSNKSRHPFQEFATGRLPKELPTGQATEAASLLSEWLHCLSVEAPEDFEFVLKLWTNQARADRATIKLHGREQGERLVGLSNAFVRITENNSIATIVINNAQGGRINRATGAIHWVMQLAICWQAELLACRDQSPHQPTTSDL